MTRSLLVKGSAGLGNRIFAVLTAILYARFTGRQLYVDWGDPNYSDDGRDVFHRYFECVDARPRDELPASGSTVPALWCDELDESEWNLTIRLEGQRRSDPRAWRRLSIDCSREYHEDLAVYISFFEELDKLRRGFGSQLRALGHRSHRDILRWLLRERLILRPEIRERVERFRQDHLPDDALGVHVRFTDKRSRLTAILRCVDGLVDRDPDRCIFVATDSEEILRRFRNRYHRVVASDHAYSRDGRPLHLDHAAPGRFDQGADALMDLYLLAGCHELVSDQSSAFADLAALLSRAPAERIHDRNIATWIPSRWRRRAFLTQRLLRARLRRPERGSSVR